MKIDKLRATLSTLVCALFLAPQWGIARAETAIATFAGGCFWCMQPPFDRLPGVLSTTVGYTGGRTPNPTYEEVSSGTTGHVEAMQVAYDPAQIGYRQLLTVFWHNVDPYSPNGQFCDFGDSYRAAIFVHSSEQKQLAEESRHAIETQAKGGRPVVTAIVAAGPFYPAEEYHQDYYRKNALRYKFYRYRCGRDAMLRDLWGDAAGH